MSEDIVRVRLTLEAETEISCRSDLPARNVYLADPYPTSRSMRGALLSALRESVCEYGPHVRCQDCNRRNQCKFWTEVVKGVISVSDLLPSCSCQHGVPIGQAPRTFVTCKICEDAVFDATQAFLIEGSPGRAVFCKKHNQPYYRRPYNGPVCLDCGERLAEPSTNMRPMIRLDATTGTVGQGGLFFVETLDYGNTELVLDVTIRSDIVDLIEESAKNSMLLQVGGGRNRGWGMVRMRGVEHRYDRDKYTSLLHDNLEAMIDSNQIIVIARTPIADLTPQMTVIPRVQKIGGLLLNKSFGRTRPVAGWSSFSNLQRPLIHAAETGSVFLYSSPDGDRPDIEELATLELTGIGDEMIREGQLNQVVFWRKEQ